MRNFLQKGDVITVAAAGAVSSGDMVLVGSLFGVASADAATGEDCEIAVVGVFDLPKASESIDVGDALYYDGNAGNLTMVAEGNTLVGVCIADAGMSATTVACRLNGWVPSVEGTT